VSRDTNVVLQVRKLRGQESNLRTRGSKPRISTSRNYPAVGGLEPTRWCLTNTCSAAELPTRSKVPCGNRTRLSRVEAWYLCRSAKGTCFLKHLIEAEAVGLEPTTGLLPAPAFEAGSSSSRMTSVIFKLRRQESNPCPRRLTAVCPYQHGLHRKNTKSAWPDLNRRSRAPATTEDGGARRISRLSHTLMFVHRGSTSGDETDDSRERKSTQRELNPHLRPGETVRCRYVMSALSPGQVVKEPVTRTSRN
jgi:hypothetical protein